MVARIKGNGSKRPILLMAHTDVVGVQRERWPLDPFGAVLKDGIQSYGIGPAATDEDAIKYGMHSDVERLLESSLYGLVDFTWNAVSGVAVR